MHKDILIKCLKNHLFTIENLLPDVWKSEFLVPCGLFSSLVLYCGLHFLIFTIGPLDIWVLLTEEVSVRQPGARDDCQKKLALRVQAFRDWVNFLPDKLGGNIEGSCHFIVVIVNLKQVLMQILISCKATEGNSIGFSYQI